MIAGVAGLPIGFLQIIDPAREENHYLGERASDLRAIDIWIGKEAYIGRGFGKKMEEVVDQVVYTDNSVCYFATRKGRSSIDKVTALCRFWLLVQVVSRVKIHSRWVSTRLMPADYLTRSETLQLGHVDPEEPEPEPKGLDSGRPPGRSNSPGSG